MKPTRKTRFSSSSTVTYTFPNDYSTPPHPIEIPIKSPDPPIPTTTVHQHPDQSSAAAAKIQAAYRSHVVRSLVRKILAVKSEVDRLERLIQRQETVDAVRASEKEKLRMNEALMGQLLELDSVPGWDPAVREVRRRLSRRIVGLQEVMDGICGDQGIGIGMGMDGWDGFWWNWNWDGMIAEMEEEVCRERGGEELERFCASNLGFRCLQRFLHQA